MIKSLERKSYSASMTRGVIVLLLFSVSMLILAIVSVLWQKNDPGFLPMFVISLVFGVSALFGSLFWYMIKARNYMRDESIEYDLTYPGSFDYYQQWQAKVEEITLNSSQF
jgi:hypothetical protein